MKTVNQTVQDIEFKVDSISNSLQILQGMFETNGVHAISEALTVLTGKSDDVLSKLQGMDTTTIIDKLIAIHQLLQPSTPAPTPGELATQAAQALADLQNKLLAQSQNVPPPVVEWELPDNQIRIYFSNQVILNMLRHAKQLVDFAFDGQFVIQYCETGAFVYVSFLNPDDEAVIVQFGGVVQVKEV